MVLEVLPAQHQLREGYACGAATGKDVLLELGKEIINKYITLYYKALTSTESGGLMGRVW
jgi:hypothetical protein